MNVLEAEYIENEIINDIKRKFGWMINEVTPIYLGYGNLKWIMKTDHDPIFVKQYCKFRYRHGLEGVRQALKYQNQMNRDDIPCQPVHSYKGEFIHTTSSKENYMISGVSEGELIEAGHLSRDQMYSLGHWLFA